MLSATGTVLQRATPESQGIDSLAVLKFVEAAEQQVQEFHSFMLLRHGKVVAEGWWSPYAPQCPHMLFSLSKSFTSTAVGLAIEEGLLSLDDTVLSFFPDDAPAEVNQHLAAMQVRHLLSMSTGQEDDTMPPMFEEPEGRFTRAFFTVPVLHQPGTYFMYNTGATYMLSAIVQKVSGQKLFDYLTPRLFQPLGIEGAFWEQSPQGINMGGFGLNIKTEDIARFGQLYLQKGKWEGSQIVPEAWVAEATAFQVSNGKDMESDWAQGYGYQFWRCRHNCYRGDGAFGQYCVVMPDQDAVLVITGGLPEMQPPLNLVWDILLPAMGVGAMPDDAPAQNTLKEKLGNLAFAPAQGAEASPTAAKISGRVYQMQNNSLQVECITLNFERGECAITVKNPFTEETYSCGFGRWAKGESSLFNEFPTPEVRKIAVSGAWVDENTFSVIVRLYETPFFIRMTYSFNGDEVLLESRINVGFAAPKAIVMAGKAKNAGLSGIPFL